MIQTSNTFANIVRYHKAIDCISNKELSPRICFLTHTAKEVEFHILNIIKLMTMQNMKFKVSKFSIQLVDGGRIDFRYNTVGYQVII